MSCKRIQEKFCGYQPLPWMSASLPLSWQGSVQQLCTCQHVQPCSSSACLQCRRCAWGLWICSAMHCHVKGKPTLIAGQRWSLRQHLPLCPCMCAATPPAPAERPSPGTQQDAALGSDIYWSEWPEPSVPTQREAGCDCSSAQSAAGQQAPCRLQRNEEAVQRLRRPAHVEEQRAERNSGPTCDKEAACLAVAGA